MRIIKNRTREYNYLINKPFQNKEQQFYLWFDLITEKK